MVGCYESEEPVGPEVPVIGGITLSQEHITVGAEGGKYPIEVYTEYDYQVSANVDWISILYELSLELPDGGTRANGSKPYIVVEKNDSGIKREGVVTFFCDDYNLSATLTVVQEVGEKMPNNQIWYTSSDGNIVTPHATDVFGANIVSNTYENGKGVITFDDNVTSIGDSAFRYCSGLTSVTIPDSVTSIGESAFYECSSLTSVTIPDSITSVRDGAFASCSSLTAFYGKFASADNRCLIVDGVLHSFAPAGLTQYTIPDSVTSIGRSAFYGFSGLTSVTIPDSVTSIGNFAFAYCSNLTSVTIPDSVTSIGDSAFSCCTSLTSVTIPDSVTSIVDYAFYLCSSLTSVTIPDSVTEIGYRAFHYCSSLTSVTIGNSVTSIGDYAFRDCTSLKEVYCKPTTPPTGGSYMFSYYDGYKPIGCEIYVPRNSVDAYKSAQYWSDYADYIVGFYF